MFLINRESRSQRRANDLWTVKWRIVKWLDRQPVAWRLRSFNKANPNKKSSNVLSLGLRTRATHPHQTIKAINGSYRGLLSLLIIPPFGRPLLRSELIGKIGKMLNKPAFCGEPVQLCDVGRWKIKVSAWFLSPQKCAVLFIQCFLRVAIDASIRTWQSKQIAWTPDIPQRDSFTAAPCPNTPKPLIIQWVKTLGGCRPG